jgi:hypothetical protein
MNPLLNPFVVALAKAAAWMLVWSWQTAVLLACVWAGLKIFRVKSPALRQDEQRAHEAKERHAQDLMSRPGVIGVGVGRADDNSNDPAIVIYVDRGAGRVPDLPTRVDDVKVRVVLTDAFVQN